MITQAERRINIKDLVIDQPERQKDGPFDPRELIGSKEWKIMLSGLRQAKSDSLEGVYCEEAFKILTLFPERKAQIPENIKAHTYLRSNLKKTDASFFYFLKFYEYAKVVFPNLPNSVDPEDLENFKKAIPKDIRTDKWGSSFLDTVAIFRRLFPEEDSLIDDEIKMPFFNKINEKLHAETNIQIKAKDAAQLKIVFPQMAGEIKLSSNFWEDAKNKLITLYGFNFLDFAFDLTVLAAEEVKLTGGLMELKMPATEVACTQTPPQPEARRF